MKSLNTHEKLTALCPTQSVICSQHTLCNAKNLNYFVDYETSVSCKLQIHTSLYDKTDEYYYLSFVKYLRKTMDTTRNILELSLGHWTVVKKTTQPPSKAYNKKHL